MTRRRFLWIGGTAVAGLAGLRFGTPWIMRRRPPARLSDEAAEFALRCFAGLDRSRIWDTHVHLLGLGVGGTGCWINPEMQSHRHPIKRLQYEIYREGTGMVREATADVDYVEHLLAMQRGASIPSARPSTRPTRTCCGWRESIRSSSHARRYTPIASMRWIVSTRRSRAAHGRSSGYPTP